MSETLTLLLKRPKGLYEYQYVIKTRASS